MFDKFLIIITFLLAAPVQGSPGILAFGDLRGHIEPCGCDPATDLGGIKRLASFIAWERQYRPDVLVVSLGNLTVPSSDDLKGSFITEAVLRIAPNVMLANRSEIASKKSSLLNKLPLVLSNLPGQKLYAPSLVKGGRYFFGYVSPVLSEKLGLVSWQDPRFRKVVESVAFEKRLLLYAGGQSELEAIIKAKLFPQIIASSFKPLDALPGRDERDSEGVLEVHKDPSVWAVPLGGSGVLRLGGAATDIPPKIDELFAVTSSQPQSSGSLTLTKVVPVSWLVKSDVSKPSPVDDIYRRYEETTRALLKKSEAGRAKDFKNSEFVGSQACLACHPTSVVQHGDSKHAAAFLTLKEKKKDQDPECLACHVVGLEVKGGFVSEEVSPNLAGVQCENCHGPRRAHLVNQKSPVPQDGGWRCEECHNAQHSPNFNRKDYWQKIKHGREVK